MYATRRRVITGAAIRPRPHSVRYDGPEHAAIYASGDSGLLYYPARRGGNS